jgi:hypothetical protein
MNDFYPLKPLKVDGEFLILDKNPEWKINIIRNVDKTTRKMFRVKCQVGLFKNKILGKIR